MQEQYQQPEPDETGQVAPPEGAEPQAPVYPCEPSIMVEQVKHLTRKSIDARKAIELIWRFHRRLYNNQFNWEGKRSDQSKHAVAELPKTVDWKAQTLVDALVQNVGDPFEVEGETPESEFCAPVKAAVLRWNLDKQDLPGLLYQNLISGQLTSGCLFRCYPDPNEPPEDGRVTIEIDAMERLLKDPTGRDKWAIWVTPRDLADVKRMAMEQGWDMEAVETLAPISGAGLAAETEVWKREFSEMLGTQAYEQDGYRGTVYLSEYWGPLWDGAGGEMVSEFCHIIVGNSTTFLYFEDDPFGDGKGNLVYGDLNPRAMCAWGKSECEDSAPMAELETRMLNSIADNMAASAANVFEVNEDAATNKTWETLRGSLKSGAALPMRGPNQLLRPHPLATFNEGGLQVFEIVNNLYQKFTGTSDMSKGLDEPQPGENRTATYARMVQGNAAQATTGMSRRAETYIMQPLLQRCMDFITAYGNPQSEHIQKIAAKEMQQLVDQVMHEMGPPQMPPPPQAPVSFGYDENNMPVPQANEQDPAYQQAMAQYQQYGQMMEQQQQAMAQQEAMQRLTQAWGDKTGIRVRGVSGVLEREQASQMLSQLVQEIEAIAPWAIDVPKYVLTRVKNAGVHPDDILVDDTEGGLKQAQQQAMEAQAAAAAPHIALSGQLTPEQENKIMGDSGGSPNGNGSGQGAKPTPASAPNG